MSYNGPDAVSAELLKTLQRYIELYSISANSPDLKIYFSDQILKGFETIKAIAKTPDIDYDGVTKALAELKHQWVNLSNDI